MFFIEVLSSSFLDQTRDLEEFNNKWKDQCDRLEQELIDLRARYAQSSLKIRFRFDR